MTIPSKCAGRAADFGGAEFSEYGQSLRRFVFNLFVEAFQQITTSKATADASLLAN